MQQRLRMGDVPQNCQYNISDSDGGKNYLTKAQQLFALEPTVP